MSFICVLFFLEFSRLFFSEVLMRCRLCGEAFDVRRQDIGFDTCLECGEWEARKTRHCVVPMNKSNYVVVTDHTLLKQLNPKRVGA